MRRLVILTAAAFAITACGGGDADVVTTTTAPPAAATTTVTPTTTGVQADATPTPACDRFTPAELQAGLGQAVSEGISADDGQVCTWDIDGTPRVGLTVRPGGLIEPGRLCDSIATQNSERLEVAGFPAVFEGTQLYVCTDVESFNLDARVDLAGDEIRDALVELAIIGLQR